MKIIIDTREQLPLEFTGHETINRKLDEGDYNIAELEDKIVIERKSLQDLYHSITIDHQRFKREILRAKAKGKFMYIFIEGHLNEFYSLKWTDRKLQTKPETLKKIIDTMLHRYDISFIECRSREFMVTKILGTIENEKRAREKWLTQQELVRENM